MCSYITEYSLSFVTRPDSCCKLRSARRRESLNVDSFAAAPANTFTAPAEVTHPLKWTSRHLLYSENNIFFMPQVLLATSRHIWISINATFSKTVSYEVLLTFIIVKKGRQCKAQREWCTPYQSENPSPTIVSEGHREGNKSPAVLQDSAARWCISVPMCDQSTACNQHWHIRSR